MPKPGKEVAKPDSLFSDTAVFFPGDIRAYMFLIKSNDDKLKLDNSASHDLGKVKFQWRNYYGDVGQLSLGPFKSLHSNSKEETPAERKDIEIQLMDRDKLKLKLEQPSRVTFRLHNQSKKQLKLQLQAD